MNETIRLLCGTRIGLLLFKNKALRSLGFIILHTSNSYGACTAPCRGVGCYVPAYFDIYTFLCGGARGCLMGRQTLGRQNPRIPAPHGDVMTNDM